MTKFLVRVSRVAHISVKPYQNHSYLDNSNPVSLAFFSCFQIKGSLALGETGGKNLGHL